MQTTVEALQANVYFTMTPDEYSFIERMRKQPMIEFDDRTGSMSLEYDGMDVVVKLLECGEPMRPYYYLDPTDFFRA